MIDYEKLIQEINKCIEAVSIDLKLAQLHASKKRMDTSHQYLLDAQRSIRLLEDFYP